MMAKKNYQKYLPKLGTTMAVAMAMTVALSAQADAAELNENEYQPAGDPAAGHNLEIGSAQNGNAVEPAEVNSEIEASNTDTAAENEKTAEENEQTEQDNDAAVKENEEVSGGLLTDPDLELPDSPELPDTDGMDAEEYNEIVGEYNGDVDDYNDAVDDYNQGVDDYNAAADAYDEQTMEDFLNSQVYQDYLKELEAWEAREKAYQDYLAENEDYLNSEVYQTYQKELKEWEARNEVYQASLQAQKDYLNSDAYKTYQKELAEWEAREKAYQDYLANNEDYQNTEAYQNYLKELEAWEAKEKAYQDYLANNEDYQNSQAYKDYLEDKAEFDQLVSENEIYDDVTEYNKGIEADNDQINDLNEALENDLDAKTVENIDEVGSINTNVTVDQSVLDTLNGHDELAAQHTELLAAAQALENHSGKNANLGSAEYAAYLAAVEAYNEAVESFNQAVGAYNEAVAAYNAAVDEYNANKPVESGDSSTGNATGTGTADWGNIQIENQYLDHIDVKYQAASSKDVTEDESGNKTFTDSVTDYTVTGVHTSANNTTSYGLIYDNDGAGAQRAGTQGLKKNGSDNEFMHNGNNSVNLNPETGTVSFYVTLKDSTGKTHGINVALDATSVYADGSYYAPVDTKEDQYLSAFRYGEDGSKKLTKVDTDGDGVPDAYDISGVSVYVISAMTCDGMGGNGGTGYQNKLQWTPDGLDLILNLQTMIELHQAENAEKISYLNYELGKTAQAEAPAEPGTEPVPPALPEPGPEPGAPVVAEPGDAPENNMPDLEPEPGPAPGEPVVAEPGNAPAEPQAPSPTERLEHAEKLEKLEEKVIVDIDPVDPDPVDPDPVDPDPVDPDPVDPDPVDPDPVDPDPVDPDPVDPDPVDPDPVDPDPIDPPVGPEPAVINETPGEGIPDADVPLADLPDEEVPLADLPDEEVPLADVPRTGGSGALFGIMSAFSGFGLAALQFMGRKKRNEK